LKHLTQTFKKAQPVNDNFLVRLSTLRNT